MTYYSQCEEDKQLYQKFFSKYSLEGPKTFFEMGALDGHMYSNTKFFEDTLGWSGVLVEPNPIAFTQLCMRRPKCKLMNALVSNATSPVPFSVSINVPAVCSVKSTQPADFNDKYYKNSQMLHLNLIPVRLDEIFERSGVSRFDFVVIDVEGHELEVLETCTFKIPSVLWLIEFLDDAAKNAAVQAYMEKNNFKFVEKVAHNAVFIHNDYLQYFGL